MRFEFATASRILFGIGAVADAASEIRSLGQNLILVRGKGRDRAASLLAITGPAQAEIEIAGEPTVEQIRHALKDIRGIESPVVVGIGGGGVIDAGKAIAGLLANEGDVLDYLEVIGRGKTISRRASPYVAIPTTAGTGSEVTRNAVLTSAEHGLKVSLRSHLLLPEIACVDPALTRGMSPNLTANTGMDALAQVMEPFVSIAANPLTDALAREGLMRARSLPRAFHHGDEMTARTDMALTSLIGGIALANARLGAVHGFASPLGGMFQAPHGAVCAILLAPVMEANIQALRTRMPDSPLLGRYEEAARILTGAPDARAEDGVQWARNLTRELCIASLTSYGVREADFPAICEKARNASSMKGNPIALNQDELLWILNQAAGEH